MIEINNIGNIIGARKRNNCSFIFGVAAINWLQIDGCYVNETLKSTIIFVRNNVRNFIWYLHFSFLDMS